MECNKLFMIGSLRQFIELDGNSVFTTKGEIHQSQRELSPVKSTRKKGKSSIESYAPEDKTELLKRYEKNNIFNINRKKYKSIAEQVQSKDHLRRPMYEHRSFFVKPEVARDYIAKEELKRKHNLLRAILRMKQTEEEPKGSSDYEQSFQRLYSGFKQIHPEPLLNNNKQPQLREEYFRFHQQEHPVVCLIENGYSIKTVSAGPKNIRRTEISLRDSWENYKNGKISIFRLPLDLSLRISVRRSPQVGWIDNSINFGKLLRLSKYKPIF